MFGFRKSPGQKGGKQSSSGSSDNFNSSDTDASMQRRASSEPTLSATEEDLENQSVEQLEQYAVNKSQETTHTVNNCLKIAEDIRGDASRTLEMLHDQGEQIARTHMMAADTERDLSKGEKIMGSLGGMFSRTWKPKKGKEITGPTSIPEKKSRATAEQRAKLGVLENKKNFGENTLNGRGYFDRKRGVAQKGKSISSNTPPPEQSNAMQQVQAEKNKQDDALLDLSNILGDLKGMALGMGTKLERQNKALDHLDEDVDELNTRMKGANQRARKLVAKGNNTSEEDLQIDLQYVYFYTLL